ncbi:NEAT domain-containing protein [Gemella sp. GH3]|uniref:NEAT domain-containing protein n=1 Tax=unclassified Gemella TaxID=2624949 RepID=UPI0015CFC078|nr:MULTISPECIES: NEAT domain-containing protein [unclassified Gemella]MBF0713965.1 NEAT domain-containing protein [Gemella sp. GH3.1]NYS50917.1 NEAT domain-containing protein [Gemella sp. GH3]
MERNKILTIGITGALFLSTGLAYESLSDINITNAVESSNDTASLDYKNLAYGEYNLNFSVKKADGTGLSMADGATEKPAKLIVRNGEYKVQVKFIPINFLNTQGYLGNLYYYSNNVKEQAEILSYYTEAEKDSAFEVYKKEYPDRTAYPKVFEYPISKENIQNNILSTKIGVFVPVMASISQPLGHQDAFIEYDFSSLKLIKKYNEEPKNEDSKKEESNPTPETPKVEHKEEVSLVNISTKDESPSKTSVRRAVDPVATVINDNGKKVLKVRYYSKQKWGAEHLYDNGLWNVFYNYDGSENRTKLESKVVESGEHYEISEVLIPLEDGKNIYLFGETQLNVHTGTTSISYGIINLGDKAIEDDTKKVEAPKLLRVDQFGKALKDSSIEKLPFDYEKNGKIYSPYTADNNRKFKLADGKYAVELQFERLGLTQSDLRYVKYTLDGSEPTMSSKGADLRSQSSDATLPSSLFRMFVSPLEDIPNFSKNGGDVVVKVKGFNSDGTKSSETKEYVLPFSQYHIDQVPVDINILGNTYSSFLTSNNTYNLTEDATLSIENVQDNYKKMFEDATKKLGLTYVEVKKISVVNKKDSSKYTPKYKDGWNADKNPLLKLEIADFTDNKDKQVYIYDMQTHSLKPIPTTISKYSNKFIFDINQQEGYYVIATANNAELLKQELDKLKSTVEKAKNVLENAPTSDEKLKLDQQIKSAEKLLSRVKSARLDNVLRTLEQLNKAIKSIENVEDNSDLIERKAKSLINGAENQILKELITDEQLKTITQLKNGLNNNILDKSIAEQLEQQLSNLQYRDKVQNVDFMIENYSRPGIESMASGIFDKNAKLIYTNGKAYLEVNLKTMEIFGTRAHLTELDFFRGELDKEKLAVHSILKYEDSDSTGKTALFDKKLLIELNEEVKNSYDMRLGNDGMGGAKPQAKFVIKSNIDKPKKITTEDKVELEKIGFETKIVKTDELKEGETKVEIEGTNGEKKIIKRQYFENDKFIREELISEEVVKEPVTRVIKVGTAQDNKNEQNNSKLDIRNLADGEYSIGVEIRNYTTESKLSMSDGAILKPAKLIVKDGKYRIELTFTPLTFLNQRGYLGNLQYYENGMKHQANVLSYYSTSEIDKFFDVYKVAFPNRTAYPKVISYPVDKNSISKDGILKTRVNVYVPVMASISQDLGSQDALPVYNFNNLKLIKIYEDGSSEGILPQEDNNLHKQSNISSLSSQGSGYKGGQLLALDSKGKLANTGVTLMNTSIPGLGMLLLSAVLYRRKR